MADSHAGARGIRFDDIAARVNPDPSAGGTRLLAGFVGKGDAEGRIRIYPDLSFGSYYDVAESDVVHSVPLPAASSPLGGSYVWVKRGAEVKRGPAAGATAAARIPPWNWNADTEIFSCPYCVDTVADCVVNPYTSAGDTCPIVGCGLPPTTTGTCPQSPCYPTVSGATCQWPVCWATGTITPQVNAQFQPTPTATFFQTCGVAPMTQQHGFAQQQGFVQQQAAALPFSLQQSCGIACTVECPPPPCTLASTLCPTVDAQSCPPWCAPPAINTIGTCVFTACCNADAARGQAAARAGFQPQPTEGGNSCFVCRTDFGATCDNRGCTLYCEPVTVYHVMCPVGIGNWGARAGAAFAPTPTATFYHTCGIGCGRTYPTRTGVFTPYGG